MPPWRQLPTEDLRALVAYIQSLHVSGRRAIDARSCESQRGRVLFTANCASCHGARGAGNGP